MLVELDVKEDVEDPEMRVFEYMSIAAPDPPQTSPGLPVQA